MPQPPYRLMICALFAGVLLAACTHTTLADKPNGARCQTVEHNGIVSVTIQSHCWDKSGRPTTIVGMN